jgi:hypothetical protein
MTFHLLARNDGELKSASRVASRLLSGASSGRQFTMNGSLGSSNDPDLVGHALLPWGIAPGDDIVVGPSLVTFDSPAHLSILQYWAALVPYGRIVVPEYTMPGGLRLEAIEQSLGSSVDAGEIEGRRFAVFRGGPWRRSGTIIDWWRARGTEVLDAHGRIQPRDLESESLESAWPLRFESGDLQCDRSGERSSPQELGSLWSYQLWAALAKIAVLRWILGEYEVGDCIDHVDMGAGAALVGAELLLDPSTSVDQSTGLELRAIGPWCGCRLAGADAESLGDRWRFRLGTASTWSGSPRLGLFTALGSLLYLPRTDSAALLERAWDSLVPGGLLVVHENIRHERFVADHDVMFDRVELENLLERFGPVEHVAATACRRLQPDQVGEKTVFRVVVKRG